MKEFATAVSEAFGEESEEEHPWVIKLDDREMRFYRPTDAQFAMYMAATGRFASDNQRMAAMIDLFVNVFEPEDQAYLIDRMSSRANVLPLQTVQEMIEYMVEEWTGRPTKSPSVSSRSPRNGGQKSTQVIQGSISSDSPDTGS